MVSPDDVQSVLFDLRDQAGFDHLSRLTAQEYQDRYESVYRVTKYDERTHEVDIVVPTPRDDPRHESVAPVYSTADWHEREAYDLVGVDVRCPGRASETMPVVPPLLSTTGLPRSSAELERLSPSIRCRHCPPSTGGPVQTGESSASRTVLESGSNSTTPCSSSIGNCPW